MLKWLEKHGLVLLENRNWHCGVQKQPFFLTHKVSIKCFFTFWKKWGLRKIHLFYRIFNADEFNLAIAQNKTSKVLLKELFYLSRKGYIKHCRHLHSCWWKLYSPFYFFPKENEGTTRRGTARNGHNKHTKNLNFIELA